MTNEQMMHAAKLSKTATDNCTFKVGDKVSFTNDYGVTFEGLRVI